AYALYFVERYVMPSQGTLFLARPCIPDSYRSIFIINAGRGKVIPIRAVCQPSDGRSMSPQRVEDRLACRWVPNVYGPIIHGRGPALAGRAGPPRNGPARKVKDLGEGWSLLMVRSQALEVPHLHLFVPAARGEEPSIRTEGHSPDMALMGRERK